MLMKTINTSSIVPPTLDEGKPRNAPVRIETLGKPTAPTPSKPSALASAIADAKKLRWREYRQLLAGYGTATPTAMSRLVTLAAELGRSEAQIEADANVIAEAKRLTDQLAGRADALTAKTEAMKVFNEAVAERDRRKDALREAERATSNAAAMMNVAYNNVGAMEDLAGKLRQLCQRNAALLAE